MPLFQEGPSKVGLFARLPTGARVFVYDPYGDDLMTVDCSHIGRTVTNLAFGGADMCDLHITVPDTGVIAHARVSHAGRKMFSHSG